MKLAAAVVVLFVVAVQSQEPLPRFRSGANLVTVDAYFTKDGRAVTDLKQEEIEILEDNTPQQIEAFRMIDARRSSASSSTAAGTKPVTPAATSEEPSRTWVIFFDTWHVSSNGSARAAAPVSELLNRVVGPSDRVGMTTPDLPARSLDLGRGDGIERRVRESKFWGQRDTVGDADPREREIESCYPDNDLRKPQYRGIAKAMIERRREQKTLRALDELIAHLGTLGDERKFVVLLTEGWVLFRQDESLARILDPDAEPPALSPAGRGSQGLTQSDAYDRGFASCERERSMLAFVDHTLELRQLAQRANRANVTFYAIDPRGLTPFDDSIGPMRPATPAQDRERMASRQGGLRELAEQTDGAVVLNTNDVKGGVARMMADLGLYYVMQYYSTNTKLDGRFRSISVRVTRPGVQVRARPGYLAPTAADARTATRTVALPAGATSIIRRPRTVALRRGPSTGRDYVRADSPQFRRTERLRVEMELPTGAANVTAQLLTSQQQALPLPVAYSTAQTDGRTISIADVTLAPLAPAAYVLQLSYELNGQKESAQYEFRIVP